jgi:hypothetical protein
MGNAVNWYKFDSLEKFNAWHDALKVLLGYPIPSLDSEGNIVGEPFSTEYTFVVKVEDDDWRAKSNPEYAEGLEPSSDPFERDETYVVISDGETLA